MQEQRVLVISTLQQGDESASTHAPHPDDLAGNVDDLKLLQKAAAVVLQRVPVCAELFVQRLFEFFRRYSVLRSEFAKRNDDGRLRDYLVVPVDASREFGQRLQAIPGPGLFNTTFAPLTRFCVRLRPRLAVAPARTSSSDKCAYQMSMVRIRPKSRIASR